MSDVLDLRDKGKIWTFDMDPLVKKSHHPITSEEAKELIRLLLRNNPVHQSVEQIPEPYPAGTVPLPLKFDVDTKGQIKIEGFLNAWFMHAFVQDRLRNVIGEYRDFLNFIPTSFNTVMDIFLTHVTSVGGVDILHKYTCIELKTGICGEENLYQIIKYENWLTRKLADGDNEMVQSILVGFDFEDKVLEYVRQRRSIEKKVVRLIKYRVDSSKNDISLSEVEFGERS
jgi:hypothetical protein